MSNRRDISINPGGESRLQIPGTGLEVKIIRSGPDQAREVDANRVPFPDSNTRLNPGFLSGDLSTIFNVDYEGIKGVSKDLQLVFNIQDLAEGLSEPAATFQVTTNDTVQSFSAAQLLVGTRQARGVLITARNNDVNYSFISVPDQADAGHLLQAGETILIEGIELIEQLQWINAVNLSQSVLNFTMRT